MRLTQAGIPDESFGEGGVSAVEGSASYPEIAMAADGAIQVSVGDTEESGGTCRPGTTLFRIDPDGRRDVGFGSGGVRVSPKFGFAGLQPSGATVLSGVRGRALRLARLRPDGVRDKGSGRNGVARVLVPPGAGGTVATAGIDDQGRIILVGLVDPQTKDGRPSRGDSFVVGRLLADGRPDPSFGESGWVSTHFPPSISIKSAEGSLDDRGRLVVAGVAEGSGDKGTDGYVVARYLIGR